MKSKGTPAAQTYKSKESTNTPKSNSSTDKHPIDTKLEQSLMEMYESTLQKQQPKNNLISEVSPSTVFKPSFLIIHSGTFDMSEYTLQRVNYVNQSIPKNLLVKITLPKVVLYTCYPFFFASNK